MKKKSVVSLNSFLSGEGVFSVTATINYNDKVIMYERGVVKSEKIGDKIVEGKEPAYPFQVIELDKKTGKKRVYKTELVFEEDLGVEFAKGFDMIHDQIDVNSSDMISLYR